jgi:hypothetical protein
MRLSEAKVDQTVIDELHPYRRGWITEVLKTRVKVRFLGEDRDETYDQEHLQFLKVTGTRRSSSSLGRNA